MSYPRNNAAPPAIGVGEVRAVADGALQTSDVLVRVKIGTGSWGAGAGTLACDATSGLWTYVPSQAETNAESFIVAIYKADCMGASATVVTSAHGVAGYVRAYDASGNAIATAANQTTISGYVDCLPETWVIPATSAEVTAATSTLATAAALTTVDTVVDAIKVVIDAANSLDGKTLQEALRIIAAGAAGLSSGAGTGTETFKGLDKTTDRLTATVDAAGNRSAITYG